MDLFNDFHLFSFLPVLAFGGVFWYERMHRQGAQKRTTYLFLSLIALALVGVVQTLAWTFRTVMPVTWPQVQVLSGILYFASFMFLEYAIHVKRIEESFLLNDYRKEIKRLAVWAGIVGVIALLVVVGAPSWQWDHTSFPLSLMLDTDGQTNPLVGYTNHMKFLTVLFSLILLVVCFLAARRVFNLQEGVIRKREYPFYLSLIHISEPTRRS